MSRQRRRHRLIAAALLAAVILGSCRSADGPAKETESSVDLEVADAPAVFEFSYRALGTRVLDCVLPNREFAGAIFDDGTMVITAETPSGPAQAFILSDAVHLDDAFFPAGATDRPWARIPRSVIEGSRADLERILGPDLTLYVAAPGRPPSGNEIVDATMDQAALESRRPAIRTPGGEVAEGFRFVLGGDDPVPVIDAWVEDDGWVARVQVQDSLEGQPGKPDPDTGWIVDYRPLPADADPPPAPQDYVETTGQTLAGLAPVPLDGCDLEIGPEPTTPQPQP